MHNFPVLKSTKKLVHRKAERGVVSCAKDSVLSPCELVISFNSDYFVYSPDANILDPPQNAQTQRYLCINDYRN